MLRLIVFTIVAVLGFQSMSNTSSQLLLADLKNQECSKLPFIKIHSNKYKSLVVAFPEATLTDEAHAVLSSAELAMSELDDYFGIKYSSTYTIYLLKNREALDEFIGEKTQDWVVGVAYTNFDNLILSQTEWTAKSKTFVKLPKLVKHEMVHSYIYQMHQPTAVSNCRYGVSNEASPHWFDEGFATYVAGQLTDWRTRVKNGKEIPPTIFESLTKGNYATAATVIEFMMQVMGKEFVLGLHKTLANTTDKDIGPDKKIIEALGGQDKFANFNEGWKAHLIKNYFSDTNK